MKKIYSIILVAASLAVAACQPTELDNITPIDKSGNSIKITATIDGIDSETKVTYAPEGKGLKPSWTKIDDPKYADKILVFTSNDEKALYAVSEISEKGVATFSYESGDEITGLTTGTKVYGIYYPGKGTGDIVDGELEVNISNQNGSLGDDTPAIMCATATVGSDGSVNFTFENQTAIVGINKLQVGSGSEGSLGTSQKLTKVILSGVITRGTISVGSNGKLQLTGNSTFSEIEATPDIEATPIIEWITSDKGMIDFSGSGNLPLSFAVIPSSQQEEPYITAVFTKDEKDYTFTNSKAIEKVSFAAGGYYYMSKKLDCEGEAVAKVNDKRYATIDAAFAAANNSTVDATITLLKDCTASSQLVLDNTKTSSIIFNLAGHKLTGPNSYTINLQGGRNLEINDSGSNGKIYSSADAAVIYVQNSSLTITGGTIQSTDNSNYGFGIRLYGSSKVNITGGKVISGTYSEQSDSYTGGNIGIYVGSGSQLTISDGEIVGNLRCIYNYGTANISGGTFSATSEAKSGTSVVITDGTTSISGGYFSSKSQTVELFTVTNSGKCNVTGGFFDRPVNSNRTRNTDNTAYSHTLNTYSDTKERYPYQVGNFTGGYPFVVTVGSGTLTYWHNNLSSAARQAKDASSDVLIKMRASTTSDQTAVNLTNDANNNITLDLNGCTLTTKTSSFITTTGTALLTIKDSKSGSDKGMITSNKKNIISLTTAGAKITLDGCKIESTLDASTTNTDAAIYIYSTNTPRPEITICNGAQVYTQNGVNTIYSYYGKITLDECEITSGTNEGGRYCVYAHTGAEITVNNNASIYSTGSSAIHSGSGNAATSIQINGGYIYGTPNALTAGKSGEYSSVFTISGGFFNSDVRTISGSTAAIIYGSIISCTDGSHTPQPTNVELSYGFKCETAAAKIGTTAYTTLEEAITAANAYNSDVTITLLKSLTHEASITLNNNNSKEITLDLNGYTLTAGVESFITTDGVLKIKSGTITSSKKDVISITSPEANVDITDCTITSTSTSGTSDRTIYHSNGNLNIDKAIITTPNRSIYSVNGKLTISNSTLTSSTYCLYVNGPKSGKGVEVTINSDSFYSVANNVIYINAATSTVNIKGGYFFIEGSTSVLYSATDAASRFTIEGGYFNKALNSRIETSSGYSNVEALGQAETHDHDDDHKNLKYTYGYK